MFKKYEFQRKKSPLSEKSNSVGSATVLKGDCNGNQKLNGVFESKDGGFANSSPITIDSSSDSDDEDISELLKSVIYEHSEYSSSSKSKKSTQVYKNTSRTSPSAQKESSEHCNNEMTGKVDGKEMRKDILKTLNEVFPNASKELIKYAAQEGGNLNEACIIVSESMKEESPIVKATKQKRKRVKPIEDSDSDACLTPKKKQRNSAEKQAPNDSCSVSNGNIKDSIDPENENFKKLKEMFTSRSNSDIKAALELTNHLAEARIFLSNPFWSSRNAHKDLSKQNSKQTETIEIVSDDEGDVSDVNSKESGPDSEDIDTNDSTYQERNVTSKQTRILSFLDDCSLEELAMIPGLSVKKANKLISLRPFESWDDMETKLKSSKALLSKKFLENTYHVLKKRDDVQNLMKRCERISKEVQMLLSAQLNEEMSQPTTLNPSCQLKPYQLTGLHWLKLMHDKKMNCILADEMGLGKTVQALSFIAHLIEEGDDGPYLIVAPASTLDNWVRELKHFYPSVSYISYYGSQEERSYLRHDIRSGDYQVIIATYQTAISTYQDRSLFRKLNIHYVVFDEGHMLKNMQSQRYQKLFNINAKRRLLLTGTPLQNDLMELMSLLCFVMPNMFGTLEISEGLNMLFSNKKSKESSSVRSYHEERLQQASSILKPFVLRRLKTDVLSQLPEKTENIVMVDLTAKQRSLYDKVFNECRQEFKKQKSSGLYGKNRNLVMPLRMTSNHPLLLRNNFDDSMLHEMAVKYCRDIANRGSEVELVYEDMTVMSDFELHRMCREYYNLQSFALTKEVLLDSGKFEYLKETLPDMKEKGDRVLLFSQFTLVMDVIEVFLNHHGYRFLRLDGGTKVSERQNLIDQFNNDKDIFIFLLSTRAGGLGINLTSANVVILHDIDFNPYNDKQAEDRCHRVGQTREVRIYKLVSKGTIEEAILNCAKSKLKLEQDVVKTQENDSCGFEETDDDVITVLGQTFRE